MNGQWGVQWIGQQVGGGGDDDETKWNYKFRLSLHASKII